MLLILAALPGCESLDEGADTCEDPDGTYAALYVELEGDCGPIDEPNKLHIVGGNGLVPIIERRVDRSIFTESVRRGCEARIVQTVTDPNGHPLEMIDLEGQLLDDSARVDGIATITRFAPAGHPICEGDYNAILLRELDENPSDGF
ncbi:MAG: hypothetical protein OXT09_27430 [Myxococcales bacterium]|nr:hypothetical protein [Myxococcales bacterium]